MIRNVDFPEVEKVSIAIIPGASEEDHWQVYVVNENDFELENMLTNSSGKGEKDGRKVETSVLKHFVEKLPAMGFAPIESIQPDVFGLTNQFWVSFYANGKLYDKKYVFTSGSIDPAHLTEVPLLGKKGVLHP